MTKRMEMFGSGSLKKLMRDLLPAGIMDTGCWFLDCNFAYCLLLIRPVIDKSHHSILLIVRCQVNLVSLLACVYNHQRGIGWN